MPPEKGSPQDWLIHAESDLQLTATGKSPKVLFETLSLHAQQAVEKALKAVLIANNVPSTKTHNIGTLIEMLPSNVVFSPFKHFLCAYLSLKYQIPKSLNIYSPFRPPPFAFCH